MAHNDPWLQELEADARKVELMIVAIDANAMKAGECIHNRDLVGAASKIIEIREGLRLLAKLIGFRGQA